MAESVVSENGDALSEGLVLPSQNAVRPVRQWNLFLALKTLVLLLGLWTLLVLAGLNYAGQLSLSLGASGFTLIALLLAVSAARAACKSIACFSLSSWMWAGGKVNYRLLLFNCCAWDDLEDWQELGLLSLPALAFAIIPMLLAALLPYSYSPQLVYGGTSQFTGDSGGLGGQLGTYYKLLTSIELMPNETRRMLSEEFKSQPRFFCKSTTKQEGVYFSTVHVPPWPILDKEFPTGSGGQRITIGNVEGFTLNSTCRLEKPSPDQWDSFNFFRIDDSKDDPDEYKYTYTYSVRAALGIESRVFDNDTLLFLQEYVGPTQGNLYCLSTVQRANLSATWVVNSTGYHLEGCANVEPTPFKQLTVNLSAVDTWLQLTVRNTNRFILHPVLTVPDAPTADVEANKVMFSLVHLVTWLYAGSRYNDSTRGPDTSGRSGMATYEVQPIYVYYRANICVLAMLSLAAFFLLAAVALRHVPHGFHGGSIPQLIYLSRNLPPFLGWGNDLRFKEAGRQSTKFLVELGTDDTGPLLLVQPPPRPAIEMSIQGQNSCQGEDRGGISVINEKDWDIRSLAGTQKTDTVRSLVFKIEG